MKILYVNNALVVICVVILSFYRTKCNPITNFNKEIKEFSTKEDSVNYTNVQTLQYEKPEHYTNFTPLQHPVKFKEPLDSSQSQSSYSRGLIHHEVPGPSYHDYDDHHYYGNEYHIPETYHSYHHGVDHYNFGHHDGHYGGHHYKHHHALAAKTVLWPIAGLALLGAAAALVTNPILLQIGVATGKRRRRDTEEDLDGDMSPLPFLKDTDYNTKDLDKGQMEKHKLKSKQLTLRRDKLKRMSQISVNVDTDDLPQYTKERNNHLIPVPLTIKSSNQKL